jgi:hypothetical protein
LWDTWISRGGRRNGRGTTQPPGPRARTRARRIPTSSRRWASASRPPPPGCPSSCSGPVRLCPRPRPLIPSTVLVVLGGWQLQRGRSSGAKPGPGAEKQLLMAIRDDKGLGGRHHHRRGRTRDPVDGGGSGGDPLPPRRPRTPRRREPGRCALLRVARQTVGLDTGPTVPASPRLRGG